MADEQIEEVISIGAALAREAELQGNAIAVECEGDSRGWEQLHRRTNRIARGLAAKGVSEGDFLTIALPNGVGFVEACYAAWKLGAVPQPVSYRLPAGELRAIVELANSPVVIGDVNADAGRPIVSIAELLAASSDDRDLPDRIAPAWKAPTSGGSTGRPKLIVAGQPGVASPLMAQFWQIAPDDIVLMPGPLYHNGPFVTVFPALQIGARVIIMPKFDAEATLREIARHRATWVYLVPTMMSRIWRLPEEVRARYDVSSLRTVWHLAAPCPAWLKEEWIAWLGPDVVMELYGGTEGQARTIITGTEWLAHRGSVGKVYPGGEMMAFVRRGELPAARPAKSTCVAQRTWPQPIAMSAPKRARSAGRLGISGRYRLVRRRRLSLSRRPAHRHDPRRRRQCLSGRDRSRDRRASAGAVQLRDRPARRRPRQPYSRHRAGARGSLDADDLAAHLADRLVTYKRPRSFEFVSEPLRDDAGKVRRSALRAERIEKAKTGGKA
jgi:bile acid-coenzyme A ligase